MKYNNHYDAIPAVAFSGTILDVGCGDGTNQRASKHWPLIEQAKKEGRYKGLDMWDNDYVDICMNIKDLKEAYAYQTVLAIHVIEHIDIAYWENIFSNLKRWLISGGYLIIGCPYKQSSHAYKHFTGPENQRHLVFNIDPEMIERYIGDDIYYLQYRGPYSQSMLCFWRKRQ